MLAKVLLRGWVYQAFGGQPLLVHIGQRFQEGDVALTAAVTLAMQGDANPLGVSRQVHEELLLNTKAV